MDEIHATSLYEVLNTNWISLKNTVMALGSAYEKPMEIKAAPITTQPHPPSGGGSVISTSVFDIQMTSARNDKTV